MRGFLSHLVVERKLSAATQQQALSALLFLYQNVVGRPLEALGRLPRGRVPTTLPVVLSPEEVARVLGLLRGTHRLVGLLLYGSGRRGRRGRGSGYSRLGGATGIRRVAGCAGTTFMSPSCSEP